MSILSENDSLLIIIDIQEKLFNSVFNKDVLKKNSEIITKAANTLGIPIVVTEQYPNGLGGTIADLKSIFGNRADVFEKSSFSALDEEEIFDKIKSLNKHQIVIMGIETHICVSQTVNALIELGYDVSLISDACGSRRETEHFAGIDRMREDGAHILTAEIALFEWLRSSKHPNFKELQKLIK